MKRLFALLLLVVAPAFAQEYTPGPYIQPPPPPAETENLIYTTLNPPPEGTNFTWTGFINLNTSGGGLSGGNIPAYNSQTGTFLFGYAWGTVNYNLFDTNEFPPNGTQIDSFKYSWEYFNQEFSRGTLSANIKFYDPNNNILNDYNFQLPQTTNGWTLFGGEIGFANPYDISDIGRIQVSFTGKDNRFWAGYYGPQVRALDLSLVYSTPPLDTNFLYWERLAGENELFTLTQPGVVRYGADGVYIYQEFQPGTYACTNGDWGSDPIGGVVKSCSFGSNEAPIVAVNCVLDPYNPECIINTLDIDDGTVDYSDPEQVLAFLNTTDTTTDTTADTGSDDGSDDGSSDGTEVIEEEEDVLVADEESGDVADENLEEMLADSSDEEASEEEEVLVAEETADDPSEPSLPAVVAAYRELSDEEKAAILADAISKNTLEGALAIASDATAAASGSSASASAATTTQTESSTRTSTTQSSSSSFVAQETTSIESKEEEQNTEMMESSDSASETLETGRQMGREALASTMSQTEQSAAESVSQAESIAMSSSETQTTVAASADGSQTTMVEDVAMAAANKTEEVDDGSRREVQQVVSEDSSTGSNTETEQQIVAQSETAIEVDNTIVVVENTTEQTQEEKVEAVAVVDTQTTEQADTFAELMQLEIKSVEEKIDGDLEFVQQVVAASEQQKQQEETNNSGFSEEEKVTIANDPALANAFNLAPNITNLEVAGVLGSKQEEKSDAEKRAEEVVAANAKEQEEINKNYMDADQSGIVAAMSADTDVSAYRTAMIRDNNIWYKPEDIYKNIVYKDNVRGSYFLEKGNTDTYKKMVEEQYK